MFCKERKKEQAIFNLALYPKAWSKTVFFQKLSDGGIHLRKFFFFVKKLNLTIDSYFLKGFTF